MCGIIGYIGPDPCSEVLLEGLQKLEYRGYDSAGMAVFDGESIEIVRAEGKLAKLREALGKRPLSGNLGIGHTRWATHGRPSEQNAHPHKAGPVVVVHNGIIENHLALREELEAKGRLFRSETDTEIISHLIADHLDSNPDFVSAVRYALSRLDGSYAMAVISEDDPSLMVAARQASPLVIGLGEGANFVASDIPAILQHTRNVIFLEDGELAEIRNDGVRLSGIEGGEVKREARRIDWSPTMAEKGGYKHFMLKEIHEQPRALTDTLRGRISLKRAEVIFDDMEDPGELWKSLRRIVVIACGTSWHAALVGKFWIESHCRIPVEVDLASEFRYRDSVVDDKTLIVAISQSGETADTLAAAKDATGKGARLLAICNVIESSLAREADYTIYTHAGPEIGVASTKAFTTQLAALYLLAIHGAGALGLMDRDAASKRLSELIRVPVLIEEILKRENSLQELAGRFHHMSAFLYIGRWINYPISLEGALKLKEISYIHAEGYPAGEMKHGPIALIDEDLPVVAIAPKDRVYDKMLSNIQEARARQSIIIAIATKGDGDIEQMADEVFFLPEVFEELEPMLTVLPLQLLAYYIADNKGTDVDQPRNLAKSVTVE